MLTKAIEADINDDRDSEMRNLCFWLGFDVMGDFVFGKSFDMLSNKEWHHMVVHLQRALSLLGFVNPAPWLIQIAFRAAPRIYQIGDWFRMAEWTHDQVSTRLKAGFNEKQNHPDLVHYLLEQGEDCFENALEFIPERWTTRREMVLNPAAFNPWGTGRHSCIARVMANDMLRVTTAQLVKRFRFRLTPGETGRRVLENMKDQLAPNPGHLALRFELR
ncbi:putative cytochrome p450 protein [Eutypa lata UCREL1]|uniref:Putative cytochrome p450 protein n=1 Tax=Eutypa lata (strain UCR-EL1) TaxID=1287681 RepID=M7SWD2_EUTLA|nr:putative cytochrome p450 protein [Eutypa lata UCREL1]